MQPVTKIPNRHKSRTQKRKERGGEDGSAPDTKRVKASEFDQDETSEQGKRNVTPKAGLLDLPVELLYSIHLYAKNPSFILLNRRIRSVFQQCPTSIKARYLLARWHEAYCYGFSGSLPRRASKQIDVPDKPPLPESDLLENGALAELDWTARFVPILPASELPYPLSNSLHRSADHFVLDYCLRYPLTDLNVLHACEDVVLRSPELGNIVVASGLWRDVDGLLHSHEPRRLCPEDEDDNLDVIIARPVHLRVTELPKRLFQGIRSQDIQADSFEPTLLKHLTSFGDGVGPFPSTDKLMLLLAVAALHVPTTAALPSASAPFNSFEGLPMAKATFYKSAFMVQLLLALGAEPTRKNSLCLYIAIRGGWLDGLQQVVERDEAKIVEWQTALDGIRTWFTNRETLLKHSKDQWNKEKDSSDSRSSTSGLDENRSMTHSPHKLPQPTTNAVNTFSSNASNMAGSTLPASSSPSVSSSSFKRRRLLDRANLDSKMLKEAVKHNRWTVANWIRTKGVVPDLKTLKLIEMKQQGVARTSSYQAASQSHQHTSHSSR